MVMASASAHAAMPGSFHFDNALPPKVDINVGARSLFFQSPRTPSASNSLYRSTTPSFTQDDSSKRSRKRSRHDSVLSSQAIPYPAASHVSAITSDVTDAQSPLPFVSTKYALAGGLDTPTAATMSAMELQEEDDLGFGDLQVRGGRGHRGFDLASNDYFPPSTAALGREGNGRSRLLGPPPIPDGLGKVIYGAVGVAGRVLQFCKATAFRGFYAGGGQGYQLKPAAKAASGDQTFWLDADKDDMPQPIDKSLVPGRFPDEDYIPDYMSQDHITPPRASKKMRREKDAVDISKSWVMVDNTSSRENSPSRLSHRKVPSAAASTRRPVLKSSPRPILPASRPSLTSYAGSPGLRSDRPTSVASARSPLPSPKHESPARSEAQRHAAKLRKRELEEDAHLKRVNQQLKAMIKEGKEALGTRFEVKEEPIDEGYADGDDYCDMDKG